jgi:hypothetical protein
VAPFPSSLEDFFSSPPFGGGVGNNRALESRRRSHFGKLKVEPFS